MYGSRDRLVIFDLDGTLVDSFHAVARAFERHGMDIGDLGRFKRRRKLLKYLGGLREFPKNLRRHFDKENRKQLKQTLTEVYRNEASIFPALASVLQTLIDTPDVRVGIVSRNVTIEPEETVRRVLEQHDIDSSQLDFLTCIPLDQDKAPHFREIRERFAINPARAFACGDEYKDYAAAIAAGIHPLVVSYGFEDYDRLAKTFGIPGEIISTTPGELMIRLCHTLDLESPAPGKVNRARPPSSAGVAVAGLERLP